MRQTRTRTIGASIRRHRANLRQRVVVAWLIFPLLITGLCLGCGLLVDSVAATRLHGVLLVPLGFAGLVVVTQLLTWHELTAPWAGAAVALVAGVGLLTGAKRLRHASPGWGLAVGCLTFAAYAAPVLVLGRATFGGYGALGDSAAHFVLIDQLFAHGHDLSSIAPSSYRTTLDGYLAGGHPTGADTALGGVRALLPVDVESVFQPFICFLAACFSLVAYDLLGASSLRSWSRAAAAFLVAQPALVYAHAAQGSVKEIAAVALLGLGATLTASQLGLETGPRRLLPTAVATAAGFGVLSVAAAPIFGSLLLLQAVLVALAHRRVGRLVAASELALPAIAIALLALPTLAALRTFAPVANSVLTAPKELGNLLYPLRTLQVFGIWPTGDHRLRLTDHLLEVRLLISVVAGAALLGVAWSVVRRDLPPMLFMAASWIGGCVVLAGGSPWADSKALMIASPAVLLATALGVAAISGAGFRPISLAVALAVAFGVLWSNVRAFGSFDPAPLPRLVELKQARLAITKPPALFVDFEESAKHVLRDDAVVLADGAVPAGYLVPRPAFGLPVPLESLPASYLDRFEELVLRRSPLASRPPASYELVWRGSSYEVWRRRDAVSVTRHLELGRGPDPASVPPCQTIRYVAGAAPSSGRLVAAVRPVVAIFEPTRNAHSPVWAVDPSDPNVLQPGRSGFAEGGLDVSAGGRYRVWIEGSFGPRVRVVIDARSIGSVERQLDGPQGFTRLGTVRLGAGPHRVRITMADFGLHPGDGVPGERRVGRVVLEREAADSSRLVLAQPRAWKSLCGRRLDWLAVVAGPPAG